MIISDTAIRKRVSVVVLTLLIMAVGLYCYLALPRESAPDITIPYVFISTSYRGVSPPDIETSITIPIENKLTGLENVKKIKSVSSEGLSSISIEFTTGTDIDTVIQKVKDKVDEAMVDLPQDLEDDPLVFEVNFSELPIVIFALSGTIEPVRLRELADDFVDAIETIPGVLEAEITGGREREIRVEVLPERLAYFNISTFDIENTLRNENQNVSGGVIHMGDGRFRLQVPGELDTPHDFLHLVVGLKEGLPVYLSDVAVVYDGMKEETARSRIDGRSAVNIMVKKRAGENIIRITDQIDALIEKERAHWPTGTKIIKLMDQARDIRNMVADLENNLVSGLLLVIVVLPFALGFRNAFLVSLSIPFSMFLSFIVLYSMGITLNMVVLFSLTLALGMLVDNAIVIIENIYRFTSQGVPRMQAAMKATSEVAYPVIGATLTTLAAFSPLLFWPGIMGEFMSYLPMTLIITLSSSLFVALVINPALASLILKTAKDKGPESDDTEIVAAGEKPAIPDKFLLKAYSNLLEQALKNRVAVLFISFAILVIIFQIWLLRTGIEKPVEFFPDVDPPNMYVNIDMPEGADISLCDRIVRQVEMAISAQDTLANGAYIDIADYDKALALKKHELAHGDIYKSVSDLANIKNIFANSDSVGGGGSQFGEKAPNHVGIQFHDFKDRARSSKQTVKAIRERTRHIAGGKVIIKEAEAGPPTGPPINIEISGDDFRVLGDIARRIRKMAQNYPFVEDIRDDYVEGTPTIRLLIDRQRSSLVGISGPAIGTALKNAYNGLEVSTFRELDEEYDITVQLPRRNRESLETLRTLLISTPTGRLVPLTSLADIEYTGNIGDIVRINNERVVTVEANVDEKLLPTPVARARVESMLADFELPPGYDIRFTGEGEEQKESQQFLARAFIVAVFLVSLVLVTQFNSIGQPFIIMTAVILSLGGAFFGLALFKMSFGIVMTGVGVISLAGVVVNNGIVLIDYINQLRSRGYSVRDAVIAGGCTRLRPVLLTAITTILGLIPMVTGISYDFHVMELSWASESSQWWRSMAMAVIFGLLVATALTLLVVPTLYSLFESIKTGVQEKSALINRKYWDLYDRLFKSKTE